MGQKTLKKLTINALFTRYFQSARTAEKYNQEVYYGIFK